MYAVKCENCAETEYQIFNNTRRETTSGCKFKEEFQQSIIKNLRFLIIGINLVMTF